MAKQQDKANEQGTQTLQTPRPEQSQISRDATARPYGADDIARRAYQRFLERGGAHGHDMDDWFEAEQDLKTQSASETTTTPHGGELAQQEPPTAARAAGARPKGTPRVKKGPNPRRPDRAADQQ